MRLRTLGGPELEGVGFRREKPLLLLGYLALEGRKPRRHLAELFWPRARDGLNSLSVALAQLRPLGVVVGEEVVEARVETDLPALFRALREGAYEQALAMYQGAFLERLTLPLSGELEEWVWSKREEVVRRVAQGLRRAATGLAALGFFEEAEALWERVKGLPGLIEPPKPPCWDGLVLPEPARLAFFRLFLGGVCPDGEALALLRARGLVDPQGRPLLKPPIGLEARQVALELARERPLSQAARLYRLALPVLKGEDQKRAAEAILYQVRPLLYSRPREALAWLQDAPDTQGIRLAKARALERLGRFREAMAFLEGMPDGEEVRLLRATLLLRLGRREEAEELLRGVSEAHGELWNLRGHLFLARGCFREAAEAFARAAARFLAQGEDERYAGALGGRALALAEGGANAEVVEAAFQEALKEAQGPLVRARLLLSLGVYRERQGFAEEAAQLYTEAMGLAAEEQSLEILERAWNNLGALHHRQGRLVEAETAYRQALALAREAGEVLLTAAALANLAELRADKAFLEEAVHLLEEAGHEVLASRYRERLATL